MTFHFGGCSLTQDCYMTGAWKMPEICPHPQTPCLPPTLQSSVKGIEVLWSVTPDLLHLLNAVWKHLCETSGSECYLVWCVVQRAQWYCSLGSFIPDLALCPAQLEQACVHSQALSVDYHQRSCWPHPTSMCPRPGWLLWKIFRKTSAGGFMCQSRCSWTPF